MGVLYELIEGREAASPKGERLRGGVYRCLKCNHAVECFTSFRRRRRARVFVSLKLAKSCPRREKNFYHPDADTKKACERLFASEAAAGKEGGAA